MREKKTCENINVTGIKCLQSLLKKFKMLGYSNVSKLLKKKHKNLSIKKNEN